jgi:hypothetical protein
MAGLLLIVLLLRLLSLPLLQIVASLVPGTSLGRSSLTTRFTSRTHIAAMGYPSQESLSSIYTSLSGEVSKQAVWDHHAELLLPGLTAGQL